MSALDSKRPRSDAGVPDGSALPSQPSRFPELLSQEDLHAEVGALAKLRRAFSRHKPSDKLRKVLRDV